tara:strand:- start:787 stop:966 length:180 start_codon:yes stop_codon:yes gene_type:complete
MPTQQQLFQIVMESIPDYADDWWSDWNDKTDGDEFLFWDVDGRETWCSNIDGGSRHFSS